MTLWQKLKKLLMLEQTLFGAFWVFAAVVVAHLEWRELPLMWEKYFWIVGAFLGARVAGMSLNRVSDRVIDAQNPRTKDRMIPSGLMNVSSVKLVAALGLSLLVLSCFMLGKAVFLALPVMIFFILIYAYTKRWTPYCHFVLGVVCGFAPLFAYVAISGNYTLTPFLLALAQGAIITSNDMVYAFQDLKFDRERGVNSFPARFGVKKTLKCSKILQLLALALLMYVGYHLHLSFIYYCGIAGIVALFYYFQLLLKTSEISDIDPIFFKSNAYSGMVLFTFSFGELLWRGF